MAEGTIGEIVLFAGNFAPRNWAMCAGQLLPINSNQSLFSILGTIYGGDGRTTFALPDLRGRVPLSPGSGSGLSTYSLGERGGAETHTVQESEMAPHGHGPDAANSNLVPTLRGHAAAQGDASQPAPSVVLSRLANVRPYSSSDANTAPLSLPLTASAAPAGGGQAHENRQPLLGLNYIICISGIFPSRN